MTIVDMKDAAVQLLLADMSTTELAERLIDMQRELVASEERVEQLDQENRFLKAAAFAGVREFQKTMAMGGYPS